MKRFKKGSAIIPLISCFATLLFLHCNGAGGKGGQGEINRIERPDGGFSRPVDESSLRTVGNATFSVNSVIVDFNEGVTREVVEDIAKSVNGTIVGFYPASNTYAFELQTTTVAELDNVINQLEADPRVNNAVEDLVPELDVVQSDISLLSANSMSAYTNIKLEEAWGILETLQLNSVYIAIIDSGLDKDSDEFKNINLGDSENQETQDPNDFPFDKGNYHGSGVAEIIGGDVNGNGPNGVLAYEKSSKRLIDYTLQMQKMVTER